MSWQFWLDQPFHEAGERGTRIQLLPLIFLGKDWTKNILTRHTCDQPFLLHKRYRTEPRGCRKQAVLTSCSVGGLFVREGRLFCLTQK